MVPTPETLGLQKLLEALTVAAHPWMVVGPSGYVLRELSNCFDQHVGYQCTMATCHVVAANLALGLRLYSLVTADVNPLVLRLYGMVGSS